jgi:GNAT superfamily N-acetyltransferase
MSTTGGAPIIRAGLPRDGAPFIALVRALAVFEHLPAPDDAAAARLLEHAFGPRPRFELRVVELAGELVAYAVFFETYSTFVARPSLYLEDLFVCDAARGRGIGKALLVHLAELAVERGCGRLEWTVLDWNENAQRFYRGLGARILTEWQLCRLDGDALAALGARSGATPLPGGNG